MQVPRTPGSESLPQQAPGIFFTCTTTNVPDAVAESFAAVLNQERPANVPRAAIANFSHSSCCSATSDDQRSNNNNNNNSISRPILTPVESNNAAVAAAVAQVSTPLTSTTFSTTTGGSNKGQFSLAAAATNAATTTTIADAKSSSSSSSANNVIITNNSGCSSSAAGAGAVARRIGNISCHKRMCHRPVFSLPSAKEGGGSGETQFEIEERQLLQIAGERNAHKICQIPLQQQQQPQQQNPSPTTKQAASSPKSISFAAFSPLNNGMTAVSNMSVVASADHPSSSASVSSTAATGTTGTTTENSVGQLVCCNGSNSANPQSFFEATEIMNSLYLGTTYDADDEQELLKHNIKRVLNVATECNPKVAQNPDNHEIKVKKIPLRDHSDENIAAFFDEALEFIREGIEKGEAVLVHCRQGYSRSATFVLAYLMKYGVESSSRSSSTLSFGEQQQQQQRQQNQNAAATAAAVLKQQLSMSNKEDGTCNPLAIMHPSMARDGDEQQGIWHTATTAIITNPASFFTPQTQPTPITNGDQLRYPATCSKRNNNKNNNYNKETNNQQQLQQQQQGEKGSSSSSSSSCLTTSRADSYCDESKQHGHHHQQQDEDDFVGAGSTATAKATATATSPSTACSSSLVRSPVMMNPTGSSSSSSTGTTVTAGGNKANARIEVIIDDASEANGQDRDNAHTTKNRTQTDLLHPQQQQQTQLHQSSSSCSPPTTSSPCKDQNDDDDDFQEPQQHRQQQQHHQEQGTKNPADGGAPAAPSYTESMNRQYSSTSSTSSSGGAATKQQIHQDSGLVMDYEDAFDFVKSKREKINPNLGFVLALRDLEVRLRHTVGSVGPSGSSTPRSSSSSSFACADNFAGSCFTSNQKQEIGAKTEKKKHEGEGDSSLI